MELSERKKQILKAVVEDYVATAEPVGSKAIAAEMGVSSATVRNELADLVELGYLEQPHTSAGRVPSPKGYRLYVNELMERQRLSLAETEKINDALHLKMEELDRLLSQAGQAVSRFVNYPAYVAAAGKSDLSVQRFELLRMEPQSLIAVLMLSSVLLQLVVITEHREVDNPQELMAFAGNVQGVCHVQTKSGENGVGDLEGIGSEQNQVARLYAHSFLDLGMDVIAQELDNGALFLAIGGVGNPSHALCAVFGSDVAQLLDFAAAPVACALAVDGLDDVAGFYRLGEHAEAAAANDVGKLNKLHAEADVGTVAAKAIHSLFPGHALQRELMLNASSLQNLLENTFHHIDNVVFLNERHLDVNLGEFGLTQK